MLLDDWAVFLRLRGHRLLAMRHRLNGRLMALRRRGRMRHDALLRRRHRAYRRRMLRRCRFADHRLSDVWGLQNLRARDGWMHRRSGRYWMRL